MNIKTAKIFKSLLTNGYIEKDTDPEIFSFYYEEEVSEELDILQQEFDFTLLRAGRRIYLIPNQSNELFLQNNSDFKKSVGSDAKLLDIYLYNYLAVFILHSMYGGEGNNLATREMFTVQRMIGEFSEHCEQIRSEADSFENASDKYSVEFLKIADKWLSKRGDTDSTAIDTKYGTIMRIIRKFRDEELIYESEAGVYKPTRKLSDLMPYFLGEQRVKEVNSVFERGEK